MGRLQIRLSAASHFTMKEVAMEMKTEREWEQAFVDAVDETYAYEFARRMELPKTNPVLGYRTAGSAAERETGEMIAREMERIGLKNVCRDRIPVDRWEFERAVMRYTDRQGKEHVFQLGAYQTQFVTEGPKPFTLVYLGKATADCYEAQDVRGKLVMGDINQREEWWINFPVYQAYRKGAAAFVAVQDQGYGEIHPTALNAQDIAGPEQAAAFSMSQADAAVIKADMEELVRQGRPPEVAVLFDAATRVERNKETWNILGSIPGREEDSMILLSAHYDSYFNGFQDDNTAVAMMLGIARTLISIGYRPRKTLVFCALAAEEWGIADSKYDWSTGAYQEVFSARPEWRGRVMADLNFELPAMPTGGGTGCAAPMSTRHIWSALSGNSAAAMKPFILRPTPRGWRCSALYRPGRMIFPWRLGEFPPWSMSSAAGNLWRPITTRSLTARPFMMRRCTASITSSTAAWP